MTEVDARVYSFSVPSAAVPNYFEHFVILCCFSVFIFVSRFYIE